MVLDRVEGAVLTLVLYETLVPVDGQGVTAHGGCEFALVVAATTGEGAGATGAAGDFVLEDDGAVRLVLVGRGVGGFDVKLAGRDGLREEGESAELEDPGLHCVFSFVKKKKRVNSKMTGI